MPNKKRKEMNVFHYLVRLYDHRRRLLQREREARKEKRYGRRIRDDEFSAFGLDT